MKNALQVILPYRFAGVWVFDDETHGLRQEPFVCGSSEIIDVLCANIAGAQDGFRLLFSSAPFPGHSARLIRAEEEMGGYWYEQPASGMRGWLCPATLCYFPDGHPEFLYAKAEPITC